MLSIFCDAGNRCQGVAVGLFQNVKVTLVPIRQLIIERKPNRACVVFKQAGRCLFHPTWPAWRILLPAITEHINSVITRDPNRAIPRCEDGTWVRRRETFC